MSGLSINHYITPAGYPLERFLDECAAAGATGVGLTERALGELPLASIKGMLAARKLSVTSVNSAGFFLWGEPDKAQEQRKINAFLVEASEALDASALTTIGGGFIDGGDGERAGIQERRKRIEDALPDLISAANAKGVKLGVEPMHPSRITNKSLLNTLAQTERLLAGFPDLTVILDAFHTWWEPDLETFIERHVSRLSCVQLSGVVLSNDPAMAPSRCAMGEGVVDLKALIRTLSDSGYRGPLEFELFAHELGGKSVSDVIRQAVDDFNDLKKG
jgi:sugar phosphate isomerase/epimerase